MKHRIIIDTDPGVDDAMAILLALRSTRIELLGLTTVFGNVDTDLATTNALRLLEIAGSDAPVAKGAAKPLRSRFLGGVPFVHGDDGQGNTHASPPTRRPIQQPACDFLIEQVMSRPGTVTLVAIGPLTNLALALQREPLFARRVKQVVMMGGNALCSGNATPAAEANILNDPDAADLVLGADWDLTMVGLDVTHKINMKRDELAILDRVDCPLAAHVARATPFYRDFFEATNRIDGIFVHDSTALAYLLEPQLFQTRNWPIRVDTSHGIGRGKTWPSLGDSDHEAGDALQPWTNRPRVRTCTGVDAGGVLSLIAREIVGVGAP